LTDRNKKKVFLSLFAVFFLIAGLFLLPESENDPAGEITILVHDADDVLVISGVHPFVAEDTLHTVLERHYEIGVQSGFGGTSGHILLSIDDVHTDFNNNFFHIYKDGVSSRYGIDRIPLEDGSTYSFEVESVN